jgi:hypothetical protein
MDIYKHFYKPTPLLSEEIDDSVPSFTSSDTETFRIDDEAKHFANVIKEAEIKVSIATIQGFLLLYKREPEMVQEKVVEWAAEMRAEQSPVTEEMSDEAGSVEEGVKKGEENLSVAMIKFEPKDLREKAKLKKKEGVKQRT